MLAQTLPFDPTNPAPTLSAHPEKPGIFALFGADPRAEPYLARTTNIRRRLKRFLDAKPIRPNVCASPNASPASNTLPLGLISNRRSRSTTLRIRHLANALASGFTSTRHISCA